MGSIETVFSVLMLSGFIWITALLLPNAMRERDLFGIISSVLAALVALVGWLLIGTGAHSR